MMTINYIYFPKPLDQFNLYSFITLKSTEKFNQMNVMTFYKEKQGEIIIQ